MVDPNVTASPQPRVTLGYEPCMAVLQEMTGREWVGCHVQFLADGNLVVSAMDKEVLILQWWRKTAAEVIDEWEAAPVAGPTQASFERIFPKKSGQ